MSFMAQQDKRLHFMVGTAFGVVGMAMVIVYSIIFDIGWPGHTALISSAGIIAALAGYIKERHDAVTGNGTPELMDWYATTFGGVFVALALCYGPYIAFYPWHALGIYAGFIGIFILRMLISFIILMHFAKKYQHKWDILPSPLKVLGAVFIIFDVVLNHCIALMFFEFPQSWQETVSTRLGRYRYAKKYRSGLINLYRYGTARLFCKLLDIGDPGHCENNYRP